MTCQSCQFSQDGHTGPDCPLRRIGVKASFSAGCNLHKPLETPISRQKPEPTSSPVQSSDRGKDRRIARLVGPNKTEVEYQQRYLAGKDARYEALTFRMANRHRYTPDWVVFENGMPIECHECKGGYALHSQQRARLAFDQAKTEFPGLKWVWAAKTKDGWRVE